MILYYNKNGDSFSYRKGWLYENNIPILRLLDSRQLRALSKIRILSRLLRLEPRCAAMINDDNMVISFRHQVLFLSIKKKKVLDRFYASQGFSHPLNFCSLKSFGVNMVLWGDYGDNVDRKSINLHQIGEDGKDKIVYTFKAGLIKHIHNIIYDKWRDRFFILTGDLDDYAGIYLASKDFRIVEPYLTGSEKYRAVQACVTEKGLIWATDAVLTDNFLYYQDFETMEVKQLCQLNGSVIYGMEINDGLLISTTVEPHPSSSSKIATLLDNRLGPGINSREVYLLYIDKELKVKEIDRYKKDFWFMRLFQYGQIMFPYYENKYQEEVFVNPMAVKKYDGKEIKVKI